MYTHIRKFIEFFTFRTLLYKIYTLVKTTHTHECPSQILVNPDLILFLDGSYLKNDKGISCANYTVTTKHAATKAAPLPNVQSAQVDELITLT